MQTFEALLQRKKLNTSRKGKRYRNATATEFENSGNENGLAEANPLIFLVGRARFELATNGLKDVVVRKISNKNNDLY